MELAYNPSPWQARYHQETCRELLGAGAAGPGKTLGLLMDPFMQILAEHARCEDIRHPHHLRWGQSVGWALFLRRTMPQLEQTIARAHRIFPRADPGVKWDSQKKTFTFLSGFRYQFGHCAESSDWGNYFSNEYSEICLDELVQFEEEQYDQIIGRCRTPDPVLETMLKVRAMSNPLMRIEAGERLNVSDPNWVRRRFVDPWPEGNKDLVTIITRPDGTTVEKVRKYMPATLYDNPDKNFVRQYEATLLGLKPHIRAAMLYGNWYLTVGSYYSEEWNPQIHVIKPFRIPDDWPKFRSMDWGFKQPGDIQWYTMDEDNNLICFHEQPFKGQDVSEVAKMIHAIEKNLRLSRSSRSPLTGPADTQLWEKRGEGIISKAEIFSKCGIDWCQADKRSRARAAEEVSRRLADHAGGTKLPGLMFFENCTYICRTLPMIQCDPRPGMQDQPMDGGDDHAHDTLCYAASYASRGRVGVSTTREDLRQLDDDYERPEAADWGRGYGLTV